MATDNASNLSHPTSPGEDIISVVDDAPNDSNTLHAAGDIDIEDKITEKPNKEPNESDGEHIKLPYNVSVSEKKASKKMQIPRIIANNFKSTKVSNIDENGNAKDRLEPAVKETNPKSTENLGDESEPQRMEKGDTKHGLRLKPSIELITQKENKDTKQKSTNHSTNIVTSPNAVEHPSMRWHPRQNCTPQNTGKSMKEKSNKISQLRAIRPKNGTASYYKRSTSLDQQHTGKSMIRSPHKKINNHTPNAVTEQYNSSYFWEHKLLHYLSPRLNHPWSRTTYTKPISSRGTLSGKNFMSCTIWIHLQASICTEWEQNSMVLSPGTNTGAKVTNIQAPQHGDNPNLPPSPILKSGGTETIGETLLINTVKTQMTPSSTTHQPSAILQALAGNGKNTISGSNNRLLSSFNLSQSPLPQIAIPPSNHLFLQNKKPKTIHRCILQRVHKNPRSQGSAGGTNNLLKCHVCDSSYSTYDQYFNHLMDTTCARKKEEKDAAALAVATVVDAGTLYQQAAANSANSQEQAHSGYIPGQSEEVIEVDGGNKPVISKVKIANLNLCPVTPKFDLPTTESAVQRATTIYQRRRKKLFSMPNAIPNTHSVNHLKTVQPSRSLNSCQNRSDAEYRMQTSEKIKEWYKKKIMANSSSTHSGPPRQPSSAKVPLSTPSTSCWTSTQPYSLPFPLVSSLQIANTKNGVGDPLNGKVIDNTMTTPAIPDYEIIEENDKGNVYNTNVDQESFHSENLLNSGNATVAVILSDDTESFIEHPSSPLNLSCKKQSSEEYKSSQIAVTRTLHGLKHCEASIQNSNQFENTNNNDTHINVVDVDDTNEEGYILNEEHHTSSISATQTNNISESLKLLASTRHYSSSPHPIQDLTSCNQNVVPKHRTLLIPPLRKRPLNCISDDTELSPTTSITSSCSTKSYSSTFTSGSGVIKKRRLSHESSSDILLSSKNDFNLDKKTASETLLILSDSLAAEQSLYLTSDFKLDARKRRRMAPIVAAVAAATVADTSHEVYDDDCPETANVTLVDHAADQARIANLKVQVTNLIANILGEERLATLGYPDTDILDILYAVLESARLKPYSLEDTEAEYKEDMNNPSRSSTQIRFKRLRRQISAARRNVELLLRICIPDRLIWIRNGWDGRRIEEVLQHIITDQARQKLQQSNAASISSNPIDTVDQLEVYSTPA